MPFEPIKKLKTDYTFSQSTFDETKASLDKFYGFYNDQKEMEKKYKKKVEKEKEKERQQIELEKINKNKTCGKNIRKEVDLLSSVPLQTIPPQNNQKMGQNPSNQIASGGLNIGGMQNYQHQQQIDYKDEMIRGETGMRMDGQAISGYHVNDLRGGLGVNTDDLYAKYRRQKSFQYHITAEERAQNKEPDDLCFACQQPGHLARDCKYGIS